MNMTAIVNLLADAAAAAAAGPVPTGALILLVYVFVLACLVGAEIIGKVPPILHTPLMSGSNAVSGIIIMGALHTCATPEVSVSNVFGAVAIALAMINVVGGFLVTDRMLAMFRSEGRQSPD